MVASAIPPPTLFHLYRAIVRHAISVLVSLHEVSSLEETFAIDLSPERDQSVTLETDERNEIDESWNTRKSVSLVSDLGWLREVFPLIAPSNW